MGDTRPVIMEVLDHMEYLRLGLEIHWMRV